MGKSSSGSTRAAQIQADASVQAAETASAGALQAAGITAGASIQAAELNRAAAEAAAAEQRRQFNATSARLQPFVDLGADFIGDVRQGSTAEGLDARIADIQNQDIFGSLSQDRQEVATETLAAAGLTRSGRAAQEASNIRSDLALSIENQLFGRQSNNVAIGQNAAAQVGTFGQNFANANAEILTGSAAQQGQFLVNGAAQQGQFINQASQFTANGIQNAANAQANGLIAQQQQQNAGISNLLSAGTSLASFAFSDERLKKNMLPVGVVGDLTLYEWDWKEVANDAVGTEMNIGFKAQEVQEKHPDCVIEKGGLLAVLYPTLMKELEAA